VAVGLADEQSLGQGVLHTVGADDVRSQDGLERRGVLAAGADFTKATRNADIRPTVEGQALAAGQRQTVVWGGINNCAARRGRVRDDSGAAVHLVVGVGCRAGAVVDVVTSFQLEVGLQAAAQVFRAHEAHEVGATASAEQAGDLVGAGLHRGVSCISLAIEGHCRLSKSASGCKGSQSN